MQVLPYPRSSQIVIVRSQIAVTSTVIVKILRPIETILKKSKEMPRAVNTL